VTVVVWKAFDWEIVNEGWGIVFMGVTPYRGNADRELVFWSTEDRRLGEGEFWMDLWREEMSRVWLNVLFFSSQGSIIVEFFSVSNYDSTPFGKGHTNFGIPSIFDVLCNKSY
jgi:hypothetical protein